MKLFKKDGYSLIISDEAYALKPFKVIWTRDKTRNKENATQELAYIFYMEDPRSDYQIYIDREDRNTKVKIGLGIDNKWKPDIKVKEAMEFYASFKTESALLLEDLKKGVTILRKGMITLEDIDSADPEKKPKMLENYSNTIIKMADLAAKIDEVEKKVAMDIVQSDKVRGSQTKAMFEDEED